jgi:hypothetical protein
VSDVLKFLEKNFFEKYCSVLGNPIGKYKGKAISASRAAEPSDILWENLAFGYWEKLRNRFVTASTTLFLLGICGILITLVSLAQVNFRNSPQKLYSLRKIKNSEVFSQKTIAFLF